MKKVDYIIKSDHLLTMEGDLSVIKDGAVAVAGKDIVDAGTFNEISKKYSSENTIGGKGKVVFPGLINTHTHAAMVYFRGLADDLPLKEWLEGHIWPAEGKWLSSEFVSDALELACLEMLKAGVTTYSDMYFYEDAAARVTKKMGMKAVLGVGVLDFPTRFAQTADEYISKAEGFINDWKNDEMIIPCIAPHATYTCGTDAYKKANAVSEKHNVPIHTHAAETRWEVEEIRKRHNKTPVEYLNSIGVLSERMHAAHCVWLTDEEIDILAKTKTGVSHCIESNLKLASGVAPLSKMLKAGVRVSFGTDGAASNNDLNILSEMSTAAKIHKAVSDDPTVLDSRTSLLMATKWGAEVLMLGSRTGTIKPGKRADLVIADMEKPHLTPMYNVYSHISYAMRASDIETVMVDGRIVVDNGRLITADEEEILSKARNWQEKIKEK
ncbi:MAG TPA: S-adenosylhomocysteine deaminase [Nitrospirae bacterium]|nr:5-methylthioadenosine/S-adenosylhomocysteine deaminase [bacterium BMS3Abin10]GBE38990.1 5-methylthioadenosine/S-adenosylhomocysteine deaminase [bacterium BMS3Bbin08]HDK17584.1 S-adenosylhomocysteine deaminase [Nitrospirota bacterium]HDZ84823.1 S-adenosylhomocysteine deaminase [Nitrospirota bacterium]